MFKQQASASRRVATPLPPFSWHTLTTSEVSDHFGIDPLSGLSSAEAQHRLAQFGPNRTSQEWRETIWAIFLEEVREPMILLLLVTGVFYVVWGSLTDALTIIAVMLTLVSIEVFNEYRAKRAIAALHQLAEPMAPLRRDGRSVEVPTEAVVPGDVLLLQAGRRIPADARLLEASRLAVDESALTGESLPVEKESAPALPGNVPLAERHNLVFAGTTITRGLGTALVVATGMATELGRVAGLARAVKPPRTPLQQSMRELTRWLIWLAVGLGLPLEVKTAIATYRAEMDTLADFFAECCTVEKHAMATARELYTRYTLWCEDNGERPERQKAFGMRLSERGFRRVKNSIIIWHGVGLIR